MIDLKKEIQLMLMARFPLLWVVSPEEETAEEILCDIAKAKEGQIYFWDFARGWTDSGTSKGNPMQALERISKAPAMEQVTLFVMKDIATLIAPGANGQIASNQLAIVRELKNLAVSIARDRRCLVILSDQLRLPQELREEITVVDVSLPGIEEISKLIDRLVGKNIKLNPEQRQQLTKACQGLTRCRISRVLAKCLVLGKVDIRSLAAVIEEKRQTIRETGILEFIPVQSSLESIGGLENLKQWVTVRSRSFSDEAREYGLPNPKGVLLAGIQGTGKSLLAKTIAAEWKLPLLRLDVGRVFGSMVGESENRIRQVIKLAEAIAPCILFLDEVDKAFANITSGMDGDSGTSQRVFGALLTWMQEKTAPVFVVMTANRAEVLPAELIRKGRIDEIFWVDLPNLTEREAIFRVHLTRVRPSRVKSGDFDCGMLASQSPSLSGAEIEQVIFDAMQTAFSAGREFTERDLTIAITGCVPLARIAQGQIDELKTWAIRSGAKSASIADRNETPATSYSHLSPLEVDEN
ncbi:MULTISPECIES: AAA family ATPase [unclassified Microcoleus]|uniref:AAA family ATPase n=1 Tax=unclassified Microcoleus TaxID=2642155 RepID=UPI002FD18099